MRNKRIFLQFLCRFSFV